MYKTRRNLQCRKKLYIYKYITMLNKYRAVSEQSCVGCRLTFIYVFICNLGVRWARQLRRGAAGSR